MSATLYKGKLKIDKADISIDMYIDVRYAAKLKILRCSRTATYITLQFY